ncbi:hypothetical protein J4Q44_G00307500, partial [Coregonus suidteri]
HSLLTNTVLTHCHGLCSHTLSQTLFSHTVTDSVLTHCHRLCSHTLSQTLFSHTVTDSLTAAITAVRCSFQTQEEEQGQEPNDCALAWRRGRFP